MQELGGWEDSRKESTNRVGKFSIEVQKFEGFQAL